MELKNYFLVVIVILAFALISINLNDMTGLATKMDSAIIKVNPSTINPGEIITISVTPSSKGVLNEVKIVKACNSNLMQNCENAGPRIHLCSGSSYSVNCRTPTKTTYKLPISSSPGTYYAKITELRKDSNGKRIEQKTSFKIESKEQII